MLAKAPTDHPRFNVIIPAPPIVEVLRKEERKANQAMNNKSTGWVNASRCMGASIASKQTASTQQAGSKNSNGKQ